MLVVAVGWQLYELTGSAFDLGLLGLAQFGPMLVLTVFVGHVADRYDHRLILLLCQVTEGVAAAILVYATATGRLGTPIIYLVIAVVGSARAFEIPHGGDHYLAGAARRRAEGDGLVCLRQPDRSDRWPFARRPALSAGADDGLRRHHRAVGTGR